MTEPRDPLGSPMDDLPDVSAVLAYEGGTQPHPARDGICGVEAPSVFGDKMLICDLSIGHQSEWHEDSAATARWKLRRGPRSWSLPPEPPEDVRKVRDVDGIEWKRREQGDWRRVGVDKPRPYSFGVLVAAFGPLTEVVDSDG